METINNQLIQEIFDYLKFKGVPTETALKCIRPIKWKSNRAIARHIGFEHATVNKVFSGEIKTGKSAKKTYRALGIKNPRAS